MQGLTDPYRFSPNSVTLACGGSVLLKNSSNADHTFSPTHGGFRDSGDVAPGATRSVSFLYKGSFGFMCTIHTYMKGTVHVT